MNIIRQKHDDKICGQCCVAMITGKSLNEIIEKYKHNTTSSIDDAKKVLKEYGYRVGNTIVVDNRKKYTLPQLAFIRIERIGRRDGHFVVHYNGKFYDSCEGIFDSKKDFVDFYREKRWRIRQYVEIRKQIDDNELIASGQYTFN